MKNIAFIYSGDETDLSSLENNRNGIAEKLEDFGDWKIAQNKKLDSELTFIEDIAEYQNDEIGSLLIYYTGHGEIAEPFEKFQLKISDKQGISLETLYSKIFQCFSKDAKSLPLKLAIVLDACYSGDTIYNAEQFGTSEIVASSLAGKQSFEVGFPKDKEGKEINSNMSLFSHYFCEAIESLQSELEEINLLNIRNYINGFVKLQTSPYSFKSIYDKNPMTIVKGNLKEKYFGDTQCIYVYFNFNVETQKYAISVNNELLTKNKITSKALADESIHQTIINKIKELRDDRKVNKPKIEIFLSKEAYGIVFPLWHDELDEYTIHIRSYTKLNTSEEIIKRNQLQWNNSYALHKNMNYRNENVTVEVLNKARADPDRISLIVKKKVDKNSKIYEGIENSYFIALWIKEESCQNDYTQLLEELSHSKLCNVPTDLDKKIVNSDGGCIEKLSFMYDNPNILPLKENKYE